MRIIGGTHRSRRIIPPRDAETTRPITDRVKQSLFDRLWDAGLLDEGAAVDIFAGTGSLGLEALSRGIEHCTFVERDRDARQRLEENLASLGLADRAAVMKVDAMTAGWVAALPRKPVRLVFCDPPYSMTDDPASLQHILRLLGAFTPHMEPGGVAVLRTRDKVEAGPIEGWPPPKRHVLGTTALHLYQLPVEDEA